jgi:hypothetical protein
MFPPRAHEPRRFGVYGFLVATCLGAHGWYFRFLDQHFSATVLAIYRSPFDAAAFLLRLARTLVLRSASLLWRCTRGVWLAYTWVLVLATRVRASVGVVGELLLVPVSFAWMGWPLVYTYRSPHTSLLVYAPGLLIALALVVRGRAVIAATWDRASNVRLKST